MSTASLLVLLTMWELVNTHCYDEFSCQIVKEKMSKSALSCEKIWEEWKHSRKVNCGNNLCYCENNEALCVGNDSLPQIPQLPDTITVIQLKCFNITNLNKTLFDALRRYSIKEIHLKNVSLKHVSSDAFQDWANLNRIDVSYNRDINISEFCIALANVLLNVSLELNMDRTGVDLQPNFMDCFNLFNKSKISKLSLNDNQLQQFNISALRGFDSLANMSLRDNYIHSITYNGQLPALKELHLGWNKIKSIEDTKFCLNTTYSIFPNLNSLILAGNAVLELNGDSFQCLTNLTVLDLSSNCIKCVNFSIFANLIFLKTLNLSSNWIHQAQPGTFPQSLSKIDLSNNLFMVIPPSLCKDNDTLLLPNITYISLERNHIKHALFHNWSCLIGLETLLIGKNNIESLTNNSFSMFPNLKNLSLSGMCSGIQKIEAFALNSSSLTQLNLSQTAVPLDDDLELDFSACPNVEVLDLSCNTITVNGSIFSKKLSPLKNISELYLSNTKIGDDFPNEILSSFGTLTVLNLDKNFLNSLSFPETFNTDLQLQTLSVRSNYIKVLNETSFPKQLLRSLKILHVDSNPFFCSCDMLWFTTWMNKTTVKLENVDDFKCRTPVELNNKPLKEFDASNACLKPFWIAYVVAGGFMLVFVVLFSAAYWNRWYLKYYFHKLNKRFYKPNIGSETTALLMPSNTLKYDGYVVYNDVDETFVHEDFRNIMEDAHKYKLHIWERNVTSGSRINAMVDAIYASRRFVAVVSNNSVQDPWFQFQIDVCLERSVELQNDSLILVVLQDVDFKHLKKTWCVLLTKTPTAHWCSVANDIRRSLFIDKVKTHFGEPLSECSAAVRMKTCCT